jgi:hypothetical protein
MSAFRRGQALGVNALPIGARPSCRETDLFASDVMSPRSVRGGWKAAATDLLLANDRPHLVGQDSVLADRELAALSVLLAAVLAGCGGSSSVHTQAPTSDPPMTPTSSSATPSVSMSSSITPSSSASAIPTKVTGAAQDAVAAYIAF